MTLKQKIDCKALKGFLDAYYAYCSDRDIDYLVQTSFVRYLEENYDYISDAKKNKFSNENSNRLGRY